MKQMSSMENKQSLRAKASTFCMVCLGLLGFSLASQAAPIYNSANGHYYEAVAVDGTVNWGEANDDANAATYQGMPGHLVSITSAAENQFVYMKLILPNSVPEYWIGGYQDTTAADFSEPAGGFRWTTGEPFVYANWREDEPNNALGYPPAENFVQIKEDGQWNDAPYSQGQHGYIVEYAPNASPVAGPDNVSVAENTALRIDVLANDQDPDSDVLHITSAGINTSPQHGMVSIVDQASAHATLLYTPDADFFGTDSFEYTISDGHDHFATALVRVMVYEANHAPVAQNISVTVNRNTSKNILLVATDADDDTLSYTIFSGPSHGTLSGGNASTRVYTPASGYTGSDSFSFRADDGTSTSNVATVSINVVPPPPNTAPVAPKQTVTLPEDTPTTITLMASDAQGNALSYTIVKQPKRGTLAGSGNSYLYTPAADYNGEDSFVFRASDGQLSSKDATVSLKVMPVNDAPVALSQSVTVSIGKSKKPSAKIKLKATDVDKDKLSFSIVSSPQHGTLSRSGNAYTYVPQIGYTGSDSFTFKASDGRLDSNIATVSISVTP